MARVLFEEPISITASTHRYDVLILNKDADVGRQLSRALEPYVHNIKVKNFFDPFDIQHTDVIFMDLNMGADAIREAAAQPVRMVMTGDQFDQRDLKYMNDNLGIEQFYEYPISEQDLRELFEEITVEKPRQSPTSIEPREEIRYQEERSVLPQKEFEEERNLFPQKAGEKSVQNTPYDMAGKPTQPPHPYKQRGNAFPVLEEAEPTRKKAAAPAKKAQSSNEGLPFLNANNKGSKKAPALPLGSEPKIHHLITTFYGAKGGVGKTTLSFLTAWNIHQICKKYNYKTCIVDMDIYRGDIAYMLGIDNPMVTLFDWVGLPDDLPEAEIEDHVIQHESGLYVLPAPTDLRHGEEITNEVTEKILNNLKKVFDVIIIDTGYAILDHTFAAFEYSNRINVVTALDKPTLKDTYQAIKDMDLLGINPNRMQLVFNMVRGDEGLPFNQLKEGFDIDGKFFVHTLTTIPYDKLVYQSINKGQYLNYHQTKKGFAKEAVGVLEDIISYDASAVRGGGFSLFRLFRR